MSTKLYPTDVVEQAHSVLQAWKQIDPELSLGELNSTALEGDLSQTTPILAEINALEMQLTDLRNRRDALNSGIWDKVKRVRNGIKAIYGDDSSQYELVGGTRLSERKTPVRKAKA